jgi:glycosyltransferase involved in cell wall biosynthesis
MEDGNRGNNCTSYPLRWGLSAIDMKIGIVTPAPPGSRYGNRVTALRYASLLRRLGHSVRIKQAYESESWDLLIALHARRSHASISRFHGRHPNLPIVVVLTGTDLYRDLGQNRFARQSVELAARIVVLQPKALEQLSPSLRPKTRVIFQSVTPPSSGPVDKRVRLEFSEVLSSEKRVPVSPSRRTFDVCVVGHLRPVKDPFRAALAARLLAASSRIRVIQVGDAMSKSAQSRACAEMEKNPRYLWLREQPPSRVWRVISQSGLCVLSSRMEGGANALGEAVVAGTPVLASRIQGSVGILGRRYQGYFEVGDTRELARLMTRAETDRAFLVKLQEQCGKLVRLFDPALEEASWAALLAEIF